MNKKLIMVLAMLSTGSIFSDESVVDSVVIAAPESTQAVVLESDAKLDQVKAEDVVKKPAKVEIVQVEEEKLKPEVVEEALSNSDFNEEDFDEEAFTQELEALLAQMQLPTEAK